MKFMDIFSPLFIIIYLIYLVFYIFYTIWAKKKKISVKNRNKILVPLAFVAALIPLFYKIFVSIKDISDLIFSIMLFFGLILIFIYSYYYFQAYPEGIFSYFKKNKGGNGKNRKSE